MCDPGSLLGLALRNNELDWVGDYPLRRVLAFGSIDGGGAGVHRDIIEFIAEAGILMIQLVSLLKGLDREIVFVKLSIQVAQTIPSYSLVLVVLQQLDALLVEEDRLFMVALGHIDESEIAVGPSETWVQLDS